MLSIARKYHPFEAHLLLEVDIIDKIIDDFGSTVDCDYDLKEAFYNFLKYKKGCHECYTSVEHHFGR